MVFYRHVVALGVIVVMEVWHEKSENPFATDDDKEQVYCTHHGAVS